MYCKDCERTGTIRPTRRALIAGLAMVAVTPARSLAQSGGSASAEDEAYMRIALDEARNADYPFGAVIVRDGTELARGRNMGQETDDPTGHGEMTAIRKCVATLGGNALRGSTLYTTGEPCAMCMGAILWCNIGRVVFAASVEQMATKMNQIMITCEALAAVAPFAPVEITGGVLADEAMALFNRG